MDPFKLLTLDAAIRNHAPFGSRFASIHNTSPKFRRLILLSMTSKCPSVSTGSSRRRDRGPSTTILARCKLVLRTCRQDVDTYAGNRRFRTPFSDFVQEHCATILLRHDLSAPVVRRKWGPAGESHDGVTSIVGCWVSMDYGSCAHQRISRAS
jgi:hypothetical protein